MESLAILERGYLYPSPGSIVGVKSECPYCIARHITNYRIGDVGLMMQGSGAGRLLRYADANQTTGESQFQWLDEPEHRYCRLIREHLLTLPIEVLTVPFWLPSLNLRYCFIFDELAVWFCSESAVGTGFHWDQERVTELVRTCWRKRLPINAKEMSKVLLAHGMPEIYQDRFEELFEFRFQTLIAAEGRKPIRKLRSEITAAETLYAIWKDRAPN